MAPAFPALPPNPAAAQWSPNIYQAFSIISRTYAAAADVVLIDADVSRLKFHAHGLTENVIPLLVALEAHAAEEHLPLPWVLECAHAVALLVKELCAAQTNAAQRYVQFSTLHQ